MANHIHDANLLAPLKRILLKIAQCSAVDQRWIMRQLSPDERNTLNQYHGVTRLQEAQRFRTLNARDILSVEIPQPQHEPDPPPTQRLPTYCQTLALKAPLYAAIVIEQGAYPWRALFLEQFDAKGMIHACLEHDVLDIKQPVKQAVFCEWEQTLSFECLLDEIDG